MSVKVSLRCESEGRISSQVYNSCPPPLEQIKDKIHELYDKVEDIHVAVDKGCPDDGKSF